jgi:hypothetical protein
MRRQRRTFRPGLGEALEERTVPSPFGFGGFFPFGGFFGRGIATPSSNRPAFDQAVGTALGTLNTNIDSALGNLPATLIATLDTTIQNDLLTGSSTAGNSLQPRLAALPSPSSAQGFAARIFQFSSSLTIGGVQGQVTRAIVSAVNQYNAALAGSTSSG